MDIDLSEYMDAYIDGCRENLDLMDKMLLALEQNPAETESVNDIFRAAHTLKGMSATMGFEKIAHFTHEMENILDKIRNNTLPVTTEVIDVLFESFEFNLPFFLLILFLFFFSFLKFRVLLLLEL